MNKRYFRNFPDAKVDAIKSKDVATKVITVHAPMPEQSMEPFEIPQITEGPENIELEVVENSSFTASEVKTKTDEELSKILSGEAYPGKLLSSSTITLINAELMSRSINRASKTRWTTIISIIVGIISMVLGGIGVWPQVEKWMTQPVQPASI
ncbi:hypothetical protein [Nitrosomonas sp. Nm33]|uniref:hypothetical protein n=1 Tax=Nitrosomonas sp. Nm33 TaxID=133724 RepID=UPI0008973A63|nr:hypothetical protein [Nitrosomonas sp. Nm33]SDY92510.1 hypothetical protein SAMN05421755_106522 [Nitrosomonas sp. Nm33]